MSYVEKVKTDDVLTNGFGIALRIVALVLPWGLLSVLTPGHEVLGNTAGLFIGIFLMQAIPPRGRNLGRWLIGGVVVALLQAYFVLGHFVR